MTVAGATYTVSPNPLVGRSGTFTVIDNSTNDADPAIGSIKILNVKVGATYTITETVPPAGYALDPNPMRTISVPSSVTLDDNLSTADTTDTSDSHAPLGSITWEQRDTYAVLRTLAGSTVTVSPNPLVGSSSTFTVLYTTLFRSDPAIGSIKILNVKVGATYTITETVPPAGYALDPNPMRTISVPS